MFKAFFIDSFSFINGIFLPINIRSSTVFSLAPKLPDGWYFLKSFLLIFFLFKVATASASPILSWLIVLDVGTIPRPASVTSGISNLMSDALYRIELRLDIIPINLILFLFA